MSCLYLQVPHPWGLSPVKNQDSPSFLDIDLPEDEEDEDFDPDKVAISTGSANKQNSAWNCQYFLTHQF